MGRSNRSKSKRGPVEVNPANPVSEPSRWMQLAVSAWVLFHFSSLLVTLLGSAVQGELSEGELGLANIARPYCDTAHFRVDSGPLTLSGEEPLRFVRLQVLESGFGESWKTIEPKGLPRLGEHDRYARLMRLVVMLAESEQPSLIAELLLPIVSRNSQVTSVRVVNLKELDAAIYNARVSRRDGSALLIQVPARRLGTMPAKKVGRDGGARD